MNDQIASNVMADDIDNQGTFDDDPSTINQSNNYSYDETGNLIKDAQEQIASIKWTVTGKVSKIIREANSGLPDLEFRYDAMGNRIMKIVKPDGTSSENGGTDDPTEWSITHYVRDATGNPMAVYDEKYLSQQLELTLKERYLYGSSRLGMNTEQIDMLSTPISDMRSRNLGKKYFELNNHLGNVLAVVTDKKIPIQDGTNGMKSHYVPDVVSVTDYYPGGMLMPGRIFSSSDYRFGNNGHEKTDEISGNGNHYTTQFWEYDPRLIRRWNLDPVVKPWESGYAAFGNNPISYSDPLGLDIVNAHKADKEKAEAKMGAAKEKFGALNKGDEGYTGAKKELKQAERAFNNINDKFQRVESKINEIKKNDIDLFNAADKLTDAGGTKVDIYVYDTPEDVMQVGVREGMVKFGDTDAQPGTQVSSYDGSTPDYTAVMSKRHGGNTITIRVSDVAETLHLAHEFGHAIFQAKNMKQYVEWLQENPTQQNKGGHGKGDPSGKAAREAEKKFR